jgi:hypothetical protein
MACRYEIDPQKSGKLVSPNKYQFGFSTTKTNFGVIYQHNGRTNVDFNGSLRLPQKRTFLGPSEFNGGCTSIYCDGQTRCANSYKSMEAPDTKEMFDNVFSNPNYFLVDELPNNCAGIKCDDFY